MDRQDAAELDLQLTGGGYLFPIQSIGGSSPVFGQTVVEVDPLLIDVSALGSLMLGPTKVDVDTSVGFTTNTSVRAGQPAPGAVEGSDRFAFVATDEAMEALGEYAAMSAASN